MRERLYAATIGTKTNVTADSTASVSILTATPARSGATLFNDSTANCFVDLTGGTASSTSFSVKMKPGDYFETPFGYSGAITGRWDATNGTMRVTEFV